MADPFETLGVAQDATPEAIHKAYRELARRWHPDRFQEGPERLWAEQKMIDINSAYNTLTTRCAPEVPYRYNGRYGDVRRLIAAGQLSLARKILRAMEGRDAEWNYHFGNLLYQRQEYEKAVVFLRIAHKQEPDNRTYAKAYADAQAMVSSKHIGLTGHLRNLFKRKAI